MTPSEQNSVVTLKEIEHTFPKIVGRVVQLFHEHGPMADYLLHERYMAKHGNDHAIDFRHMATHRGIGCGHSSNRVKQTIIARRGEACRQEEPLIGDMGYKVTDPRTNKPAQVWGLIKEHGATPVGLTKTERRDEILTVLGQVRLGAASWSTLWAAVTKYGDGLPCCEGG